MSIRRRKLPSTSFVPQDEVMDRNDCFVAGQGATYFKRILKRYPYVDVNTMEFCCWILGPSIDNLANEILKMLSGSKADRFKEDLEDCMDHDDWGTSIIKILRHDKSKTVKVIKKISYLLHERQQELSSVGESRLEKNARQFKKLFSLTDEELELCLLLFLVESWEKFRRVFHNHLEVNTYSGHKYLCAALDISPALLSKVLRGKLVELQIISQEHYGLELNKEFLNMFVDPSKHVSQKNLYREVRSSEIPLSFHMIPKNEVSHISWLLKEKKQVPTHILLYGPPGTGKTSFARALAAGIGVSAYEVMQDENNKSSKRRAAMQACLNMTNNGQGSVLIVDEADKILSTLKPFFSGEVQDKGWLNNFLEEPGVRAIWIVNNTKEIEESVLRRFSYSLYFSLFSRQKRIQLWDTIVRHNKAGRYFKKETIYKLAENYEVSPGIIDLAIKQAKEGSGKSLPSFVNRVRLALDAHLRLTNQGIKPKRQNTLDKNFILEGLNIHGNIDKTISQLKNFNVKIKNEPINHVCQYNILFYGPPGTGKSQMAKYLAREIDRDIMIRRGSDLLDMFVGGTEKLIAGMFAEAEARDALLLVDEADSFIFGREMAHRSWEVSMVNEFLTRMESYQGILICTTNRFNGLDNASIRRFNQKLHFDYLDCKGVEVFYRNFLSPLCKDQMMPAYSARLARLTNLTPGDFKNIRDIHAMQNQSIDHLMLLAALEQESNLKKSQQGKKVGF